MVSNKANENNKRGFNPMANRQRFKPGVGKQQHQMGNIRNMGAMLFNANQLGDNPGFLDFNDDSIASTPNGAGNSSSGSNTGNGSDVGNKNVNGGRKLNPNMKRPMKNGAPGMRHRMNGMPNHWGPPLAPPNMFPGHPAGRRGPMNLPPPPPPPPPAHYRNGHGGGMRMRGPPNGRFGAGPQGPMSLLSMNRPIPAPLPPMGGRPMPPPHAMGHMMPPPLRQGHDVRRNVNGNLHGRGRGAKMNAFPRNGMATNGVATSSNGKRGRPKNVPNREEYPLDKPWVTEEIKAEHDKKADLANRLKGHRDDALFAQFKDQRDKFVKMYEAARVEFDKKLPDQDVEKMSTEPVAGKKARIENVEKKESPDDAVSAETVAKTETETAKTEANCDSTTISASTATSAESAECSTDASITDPVVPSSTTTETATPVTPPSVSTTDTTEITAPTAVNDEAVVPSQSAETHTPLTAKEEEEEEKEEKEETVTGDEPKETEPTT